MWILEKLAILETLVYSFIKIFVQYFTVLLQYFYGIFTVFLQYLYCIFAVFWLYFTVFLLYFYCIFTVFLYCIFTIFLQNQNQTSIFSDIGEYLVRRKALLWAGKIRGMGRRGRGEGRGMREKEEPSESWKDMNLRGEINGELW